MTATQAETLCLALGLILFCLGTLLGIPHGRSKGKGDAKNTELWRIAHLSTCVGGLSLLALGLALPRLFADRAAYVLAPFTLAGYCFFLACTLSAQFNTSWDDDRGNARTALVYGLQIVASLLAILAVASSFALLGWRFLR